MAFGDSLTYGTGASKNESYPKVLQSLTHRRVINRGIPGEISQTAVKRFITTLEQTSPDLIILCHGGNDFLRKLDIQQTKANLASMIQAAKQRNIPLVLLAVPEVKIFGGPAPMYKELAEKFKVILDNKTLNKILRTQRLKADPIHPNSRGYKVLAESIHQLLIQSGFI